MCTPRHARFVGLTCPIAARRHDRVALVCHPLRREMRIFMRLLNLKGQDAFLLEAIFRKEAWGLISDPVSLDNETDACTTMINGVAPTRPPTSRPRSRELPRWHLGCSHTPAIS